jgi:hypothetical protein
MSMPQSTASRREFFALALGGFPFFWRRPRTIGLAGAQFRIVRNGRAAHRYLVIHGDEVTAYQVLAQHIRAHEGIAYLVEGHDRTVAIGGGTLDPNRMFSRAGAAANLQKLNPQWSAAQLGRALDELDRHRNRLVKALLPPPGGRTVALHNNSRGYSVRDEVPISDRTSLKEPDNPHAFFLCTDAKDYEVLAGSPYNVVLQQKAPPDDDGSLSRLAALRGARYVNLEVALGQLERQKRMMQWLEEHLP